MTEPDLPPPERCANNLHRAADRPGAAPEATDLCRTDLGVVHMLDCPLFLGRRCAWFGECADPHPTATDAEIAAAREELQRDFLSWPYRTRVRNLSRPRDLIARKISIEALPSPLDVEAPIVLKAPPPEAAPTGEAAAEAAGVAATVTAGVAPGETASDAGPVPAEGAALPPAPEEGAAPTHSEGAVQGDADLPSPSAVPPAPAAVEYYPGQRRSEDRGQKRERRRPKPPVPTVSPAAASDPGIDGEAGFGSGIEGAPDEALETAEVSEPVRPKTVEQLLAILPEAPLTVDTPRRGDSRGRTADARGARPPRDRGRGGARRGDEPRGGRGAARGTPRDAPGDRRPVTQREPGGNPRHRPHGGPPLDARGDAPNDAPVLADAGVPPEAPPDAGAPGPRPRSEGRSRRRGRRGRGGGARPGGAEPAGPADVAPPDAG